MKSSLQPTSINDLNPLSDFLARAFDAERDAAFLNPAMMAWKYWDQRNDWNGPRSYVMMRDGVITAHAGLWPMTFGEGAGAVRGIHMIDWASAKEAPGAGLALVQKLAGMFDFNLLHRRLGGDLQGLALVWFRRICASLERGAPPAPAATNSDPPESQLETRSSPLTKFHLDHEKR